MLLEYQILVLSTMCSHLKTENTNFQSKHTAFLVFWNLLALDSAHKSRRVRMGCVLHLRPQSSEKPHGKRKTLPHKSPLECLTSILTHRKMQHFVISFGAKHIYRQMFLFFNVKKKHNYPKMIRNGFIFSEVNPR